MEGMEEEIILADDFNARVHNDYTIFFKALEVKQNDTLPPISSFIRHSKDSHINLAGIYFAEFCIQSNRIWMNGFTSFPNSGEFTFTSAKGCSVTDYFLLASF